MIRTGATRRPGTGAERGSPSNSPSRGDASIHLRGLHYAIVARGGVLKPDGEVYVNDDANWTWLQSTAAKAARWLGYVPFTAITDERNAAPVIHRKGHSEPETWISVGLDVEIPDADDLHPTVVCDGFVGRQPYHLVIIGEKSSLADVILPIAQTFHADLYLPTGEISDTLIYQMASDAAEDGRPLRVFYLSDFDPAGYEMPVNVGRKLQAHRDLKFHDLDFEVRSVALTVEQVRDLDLPSTPLKETELRGDRWRAAWGVEQTEIDALATLQPHVLAKIVTDAINPFFDRGLDQRVFEAQGKWLDEAQSQLDEQIDQDMLVDLRRQAEQKLAALQHEIDDLNRNLRLATEGEIYLPKVSIPEPKIDPNLRRPAAIARPGRYHHRPRRRWLASERSRPSHWSPCCSGAG